MLAYNLRKVNAVQLELCQLGQANIFEFVDCCLKTVAKLQNRQIFINSKLFSLTSLYFNTANPETLDHVVCFEPTTVHKDSCLQAMLELLSLKTFLLIALKLKQQQVRLSRATLEFQVLQVPSGLKLFNSQVIYLISFTKRSLVSKTFPFQKKLSFNDARNCESQIQRN